MRCDCMERSFEIFGSDGVLLESGMKDVEWIQVRAARDQALKDSDWRALKDVTLPNPWKEFRDLLRTLPQRFDDPNNAADAFPEAPSDE